MTCSLEKLSYYIIIYTSTCSNIVLIFPMNISFELGVVIGPLSRKVGCRPVVCVGSLLMTSGYLISFFSPSVNFLYITFGLLTGKFNLQSVRHSISCVNSTGYFH